MDPVLAQAILQLLQGDKDLSGLTGAAKQPLLQYLSGAYNPMSGLEQTQTPLWTQYAGNPEYPAVNEIINLVQQGADEFQVKSAANRMANMMNTDIFDSDTFVQLAGQLQKDFSKNKPGGEDDYWAKTGLARPEDIYSIDNLPSDPVLNTRMQESMLKEQELTRNAQQLRSRSNRLREQVGPLFDVDLKEKGGARQYLTTTTEGRRAAKQAGFTGRQVDSNTEIVRGRNLTVKDLAGDMGKNMSTKQLIDWLKKDPAGQKILQERKINPKAISGSGVVRGAQTKLSDVFDMERTGGAKQREKSEYAMAEARAKQAEDAAKLEEFQRAQYAEGFARGRNATGRTPLNDQLRQMAAFLGQAR